MDPENLRLGVTQRAYKINDINKGDEFFGYLVGMEKRFPSFKDVFGGIWSFIR